MVPAGQVRAAAPVLVARLPAQAVHCRLAGFDSPVGEKVQEAFLGLLGEERVRVAVEGVEGGVAVVVASTLPPGQKNINTELKDLVQSRSREERKAAGGALSDLEELYITKFDNCNNFYGQLTRTGLSELQDFLAVLSTFCSGKESVPLYRGSENHRGEVGGGFSCNTTQ